MAANVRGEIMNRDAVHEERACVLIVDDSQSIQKYVRELLEKSGFKTLVAGNGSAGLEFIRTNKPDVVLLDIEMPVMTGLEVLDIVGHDQRIYSIILFSHLSDIKNRIRGLDKGADDYIIKPIEPDELIARVKVAVRNMKLKRELVKAKLDAEAALEKCRKSRAED